MQAKHTKQSNRASEVPKFRIMVSYKAIVLAAAICLIFQAAFASHLSIYTGPNCLESTTRKTIGCTNGHGSGYDHGCINFGDHYAVSYTFKYHGTPLKLYYGANCGGQPVVFTNDIGCTQVANAKSYKVLCYTKATDLP